jgi:hypothetical protein
MDLIGLSINEKARYKRAFGRLGKPLDLYLVEPSGIEPLTSTLPVLRSPS